MRHSGSALENRIVLHALVEQLFARRKNPLARVGAFVRFVVFTAGSQLVKAQAAGSRGGVGVLVDGGAGAGVLGWALDWGGRGDGLAGAFGEGAGCLEGAGG